MTGGELRADGTVSVLVVNWNTRELLEPCLDSVFDASNAALIRDVVIVDNGSTDGSAAEIERRWPQVRLVRNQDNRGYTRANNQGLVHCDGDYVLLLNTDAWLLPGALATLLHRLTSDPVCAVVGPRLEYGDGHWQRWTAGNAPSVRSLATYLLFLDRTRWGSLRGLYLGHDVLSAIQRDWVSSACMLVRRSALAEIGGMDESFFCYMDDVDICQRLRDRGWNVWYEPAARAVHLMGQSTKRRTGTSSPTALVNLNRYITRERGRASGGAVRALEAVGFAARAAAYRGRALSGGGDDARAAARDHWRNARIGLRGHP